MEHPLFPAQEAKREAIERVERNASPDFLDFARTIALRIASAHPTGFTTDAIWEVLDASGIKTPEPRALGSVMKRLADEGLIRKTGEYVDSIRPQAHARPIPIWRKA
jgi:hypothetical protein